MIVGLPLGHSRGVGDYRGRSWRDYLMVEDTGAPRSIARGPRFDCERDVTEQAGPPTEERWGMSRALLKLSGSLVHDYATISDDSPSPNRASRARRAATSAGIS